MTLLPLLGHESCTEANLTVRRPESVTSVAAAFALARSGESCVAGGQARGDRDHHPTPAGSDFSSVVYDDGCYGRTDVGHDRCGHPSLDLCRRGSRRGKGVCRSVKAVGGITSRHRAAHGRRWGRSPSTLHPMSGQAAPRGSSYRLHGVARRFALDFGRENPPLSRFKRVAGGSAGAESLNSAIVRSQVCVTAQAASYGVGAITTLG